MSNKNTPDCDARTHLIPDVTVFKMFYKMNCSNIFSKPSLRIHSDGETSENIQILLMQLVFIITVVFIY